MPRPNHPALVALRLTGAALAQRLDAVWGAGDAAMPLDPSDPGTQTLLDLARPARLIDATSEHVLPDPLAVDEGTALVVATSGTSGTPKLVELTHSALNASARASAVRLGSDPGDRWLCCLPLHHIAGLGILVRSKLLGVEPVIHERFDPQAFDAERDVSLVSLVPATLSRLLDAGADLARFRAVFLGGATIPVALLDRARNAGANIVTTYGMTETCGGCVYDGVPLDGVAVRIDDDGAIALRGPMLMRCYRNAPALTDKAFREGWFRTADAGEIDTDGVVRVVGRLDDMIVTGGKKVAPAEVEGALATHPAIQDVAVYARTDPEWGSRVVAAIVPRGAAPSLDELRAWLSGRLASYKRPREIVVVAEIPHNEQGKLDKKQLRRDGVQ